MNIPNTQQIYINLLEEGTPTLRPTQAIALGNHLYELLPTPDYDPEDEVWEFEPGSIVMGQSQYISEKESVLVAIKPIMTRTEILSSHPHAKLIDIEVRLRDHPNSYIKTEAIDLKNGFYKLLPTSDYNPHKQIWEYPPGSVVRVDKGSDKKIWRAFDQIREDRMEEYYARHIADT